MIEGADPIRRIKIDICIELTVKRFHLVRNLAKFRAVPFQLDGGPLITEDEIRADEIRKAELEPERFPISSVHARI